MPITNHQAKGTRKGKPSVLIVEDNTQLATCLEMLLEAHSYEVYRTTDGLGGLKSVKLMDFDAILCDYMLPGLTGDLFYSAVQMLKPHLCSRFVFMSGHSEGQSMADFASSVGSPFLAKPFALSQMLDAINGVVKGSSPKQDGGTFGTAQTEGSSVCRN